MINDLKPYPEYRDSGLPWLGKVPPHWRVVRNGNLFRQRNQTGFAELPILEVSLRTGVRVRDFETSKRKQVMSDFAKYKRAAAGDIAYNMMRMWQGAVGIAPVDGLVSPAYVVAAPFEGVEPRYFNELFRTATYMAEVDNSSRGIVKDRNRLYWDQFKTLMSPCPPPDEQAAIVRFLGWINRRIDHVIRGKRRKLQLVQEMLQVELVHALQSHDVKRSRLKNAAEVINRPIDRIADQSYTRIGLYNRGRGLFHKTPADGRDLGDSDFFYVHEGDFIVSGQFAWEGAVALASAEDAGCIVSHRYLVLRGCGGVVSSPYLYAFFRSSDGALLLDLHSRGAAGRNRPLNTARFIKQEVPYPSMPAQERIAALLERERAVAQSLSKAVAALNEYRHRLSTDAVLGRMDVRVIASRLPVADVLEASDGAANDADIDLEDAEEDEAA